MLHRNHTRVSAYLSMSALLLGSVQGLRVDYYKKRTSLGLTSVSTLSEPFCREAVYYRLPLAYMPKRGAPLFIQ